jgi:hypothetical protein
MYIDDLEVAARAASRALRADPLKVENLACELGDAAQRLSEKLARPWGARGRWDNVYRELHRLAVAYVRQLSECDAAFGGFAEPLADLRRALEEGRAAGKAFLKERADGPHLSGGPT